MSKQLSTAGKREFITRKGAHLSFTTLGFGSSPLGNYTRVLDEEECDRTLELAWDSGLRYYDTAPFYGFGLSELRVGRLLRQKDRKDYVISTKVGRVFDPCKKEEVNSGFFIDTPQVRMRYDYSYDGVMRSYEESLERLGIDSVDILYVHDICALVHGSREASEKVIGELFDLGGWKALSELRDSGDVSAIGAGVNEWQPCSRLLELGDPDLFLLAGRYTLLEQEPLHTLFPQCADKNARVVIGGPYNSGVLAGTPTYNYGDIPVGIAEQVEGIAKVCARFNVPMARAALHFVAAHPLVVSVIPGSQDEHQTRQNASLLNEEVPSDFWAELKAEGLIHPDAPTPD